MCVIMVHNFSGYKIINLKRWDLRGSVCLSVIPKDESGLCYHGRAFLTSKAFVDRHSKQSVFHEGHWLQIKETMHLHESSSIPPDLCGADKLKFAAQSQFYDSFSIKRSSCLIRLFCFQGGKGRAHWRSPTHAPHFTDYSKHFEPGDLRLPLGIYSAYQKVKYSNHLMCNSLFAS